jgi:hypothetical protein
MDSVSILYRFKTVTRLPTIDVGDYIHGDSSAFAGLYHGGEEFLAGKDKTEWPEIW